MRPLILSGGPAAGKSTCGRVLAGERGRGAFIDVDDVRQLVVSGARTLWSGAEGETQFLLAARNASAMARNFVRSGFDVVIADFTLDSSLDVYRAELPGCFVVHFGISLAGARERARTRPVHLAEDEFDLLHELIATPPAADLVIDVDGMSLERQVQCLREAWNSV